MNSKGLFGILLFILCILLTASVNATFSDNKCVYEYEDVNMTVSFQEDSVIDNHLQKAIADSIVYGTQLPKRSELSSILCDILGHSYVTEYSYQIEHKVRATEPRCRKYINSITICSRCNDMIIAPVMNELIYCCPED